MKPSEWLNARTTELSKQPQYDGLVIPAHLQAMRELLDEWERHAPFLKLPVLKRRDVTDAESAPVGPTGPPLPDLIAPGANGPAEPELIHTYTVFELLQRARSIWGPEHLAVSDVVIRLGVDFGSLARLARGSMRRISTVAEHRTELEAAFGNIIFSMIRWADSAQLDVHACIARAIAAQAKLASEKVPR